MLGVLYQHHYTDRGEIWHRRADLTDCKNAAMQHNNEMCTELYKLADKLQQHILQHVLKMLHKKDVSASSVLLNTCY